MKPIIILLLSLVAGASSAQRYIDTDSTYHVTHVRFDLTVPRIDTEYLEGSVRLLCVSRGLNDDHRIELRLRHELQIDSILGHLGQPLSYTHPLDTLYVTVEEQYPVGSLFDVTVFYHGFNRSGAFIHAYQVWPPDSGRERLSPPVEWTASEPFGSHFWWPCHENPADKIDSADLYISCAKGWVAASNGLLRSVTARDTFNTFWWHESYPIDHYLLAFSITDYDTVSWWHRFADGDSLRVENYVFPRSADTMRTELHWLDTIFDRYEEWFGPYPFRNEKYGIAQWHGGGMENQTLSFCNDGDLELLAHETAHQWFGDGITCKFWEDCWLNEGFATYSTDLFRQYITGEAKFDSMVVGSERYVTQYPDGAVRAQAGVLDTFPDDYWRGKRVLSGNLVYDKGSLVLHMLHFILGSDSAFFHAMRSYMMGPQRYGVATSDEFEKAIERWSGKDLRWFFNEWVYQEGYPLYSLAWSQNDGLVSLAIEQQGSSPKSPIFSMPIELRFRGRSLDTTVTIWNDRPLESYVFQFSQPIDSMQFDSHNYLIDGELPRTLDVAPAARTADQFTVEAASNGNYVFNLGNESADQLTIFNTRGEIMRNDRIAKGLMSTTLNLSDVPSGAYFARYGQRLARFAIVR